MKKIFVAATIICASLSSCGGGNSAIEADYKKMIDKACELQKLSNKVEAGDTSVQEQEAKLRKEVKAEAEKFAEKYKNKPEDKALSEKFTKMAKDAMANCK